MTRRLQRWLEVLPPVEGADIKLLDPVEARQLCSITDVPAATDLPSHANDLPTSNSVDVESDAHRLDAKEASEAADWQCPHDEVCGELQQLPDFPLLPVSRGFHLKLQKLLTQFETTLTATGISTSRSSGPS